MVSEDKPVEEPAVEEVSNPAADAEDKATPETAAGLDPAEMTVLLEDARAKADEHWNQSLRLQAEMENMRKRHERDLSHAHKFALEKFVQALLPVKDSLEMGISAASEGESIDPGKLLEGSELTLQMLAAALEKFGVKEVNPAGEKFNPEFHEAMSMQPRADVEPNTVVAVVQRGYLLNERLVRPAMVMVSKAEG